ncbi:MAG: hypothetical protein KatS3mg082_2545 [Nitrospiraceae bacterium]|nr:MAG: hypothetical protein KatS3mg082_2545 [Nitrospiraceae bacterium]
MGLNDKLQPGQVLRKVEAADWNAMVDAARSERARQNDQHIESRLALRPLVTAKVRNNHSAPLPRFGAVALRTPIISPLANLPEFHRQPTFDVAVASALDLAAKPTKPAIVLQPLAAGVIGDACLSGVVPARVDIQQNEHRFADLTLGQTYLTSSDSGSVEILWAEDGLGLKWALVRIPAFPPGPLPFHDLIDQPVPPASPSPGHIRLYQNNNTIFFLDDAGNRYHLCASGPPGTNITLTETKDLHLLLDKCMLRLRWQESFVTFERNANGCVVGLSVFGPFPRESSVDLCDCKPEYCGGGYYGGGGP